MAKRYDIDPIFHAAIRGEEVVPGFLAGGTDSSEPNGESYLGDGREQAFPAFGRHLRDEAAAFTGPASLQDVHRIDPGYAAWAAQNPEPQLDDSRQESMET